MRSIVLRTLSALSVSSLMWAGSAQALPDASRAVDSNLPWVGFINVLDLPDDGGALQFQTFFPVADLAASFSGGVLTLSPNTTVARDITAGHPDYDFWWKPDASANKIIDANLLTIEDGLQGRTVTFSGQVLSNTLVGPYTAIAFVRDFVPDYSSFVGSTAPLVGGQAFSVTLAIRDIPGHHVQYGFAVNGPNAQLANASALGNVQIAAVPEPHVYGMLLAGLVAVGVAVRRSRRTSSPSTPSQARFFV